MMPEGCRRSVFDYQPAGVVVTNRGPVEVADGQAGTISDDQRASRPVVARDDSTGKRGRGHQAIRCLGNIEDHLGCLSGKTARPTKIFVPYTRAIRVDGGVPNRLHWRNI